MEAWILFACIEHKGHYLHIENQATGKTSSCNIKDVVLEPPVKLYYQHTIWQSRKTHQPS